jgi:NAD(P)-dependent dehydrogenase (short-subunit alcohol dehydrogenase family)
MEKSVALITGAGRGIGRACAVEMARRGYRLVLVSRTELELAETAKLAGGESIVAPADVTRPADVAAVVEAALRAFGGVRVLINNAGAVVPRSIEAMSIDEWRLTLDTNLSAAFYFCKALWPHWRAGGGGRAGAGGGGAIVNVSSVAARDPFGGLGAYGAAKAGVNLLTTMLAREGAAIGVRAYAVAPGATETAMFRSLATPQQYPKEKTMEPSDVARVIAQCADGDLQYANGETIYVRKTLG